MIRVVIAEDQAMVLGALAALLEIEGDIEVAGRAHDGGAALELCTRLRPDVLLTDIEMPQMTGLELAAAVRKAALPTRVIILTTFARGGYLRRALSRMPCDAFTPEVASSIRSSPRKRGASPIR